MTLAAAVRPFRIGNAYETTIDRSPADDTLRKMAELLRDARPGVLVSGIAVAAVTVGFLIEAVTMPVPPLHAGGGTVICLGLLAVLAVSAIRTAALMIFAGRPLMDQLGELRRRTGAPVDPTVPWTPVRSLPLPSQEMVMATAQAVLSAAHLRTARIHQALGWASVTMISFCAWSLALLIVSGRI